MNKNEALHVVYENILGEHSILQQLREGGGLNKDRFNALVTAMEFLIVEYKNVDVVPKNLHYRLQISAITFILMKINTLWMNKIL